MRHKLFLSFDLQLMTGIGRLRNRLSSNSDAAVVPAFQGQLLRLHSHRFPQFASHLHISKYIDESLMRELSDWHTVTEINLD